MDSMTEQNPNFTSTHRFAPGNNANPTGKGGFQERPQDRGSWTKDTSPTRLIRKYGDMTVPELQEAAKRPDITVLQKMTIKHLLDAMKDSKTAVDIINRLDGRPRQTIEQTVRQAETPVINLTVIPSKEKGSDNDQ